MNQPLMNDATPAPSVAQPKTLDEKLREATAEKALRWAVVKAAKENLAPYQQAYDTACQAWAVWNERVKVLEAIKKEGL